VEFEFTVIPLLRVFEPLGREIRAGTTALDIGEALIPHESIQLRQTHCVRELAHRFAAIVKRGRAESPPAKSPA